MIGEVNFYGVYFPSLLVMMVIAFAASSLLRRALARLGLYRAVWHRSLFNFALYLIVLGATIALFHG
ncbi:DUF1656 domain-containing protein [Chromobacterium violaceum]|uniref:Efflux system membrane protein n=1 Tax=Chromobacterium violaceum TaxID=536 RepID=A0A1R0MHE5_CHRVL|nr:DUF1656 domain-containing protein [Chromobacterium violaceum]OLZ78171.1 hypothetical protein BS642_13575 [Chromobacterium violaceum]OVE49870.1 hypothetical protein CBW21_04845 [Chromobacterium violaceum]QIY81018.1 DUF1656 domain-containing protein [Chromobacterium violaceum]STB64191.1 efflux system membrane protein [Chromobacterium violaceum]SUX32034.1 efflux system membrane protein [Chromobacterium violaceum]